MVIGRLEFAPISCPLGERSEPTDFLRIFEAKIIADIDEHKEDREVGYLTGCIIQLSLAADLGYPFEAVFDATESVARMQPDIYDLDNDDFCVELDILGFGDILYFEELGTYPEYRGMGFGLRALRAAEQELGRAGVEIAVLEPFLLQFSSTISGDPSKLELEAFSRNQDASALALRNYYNRAEFREIAGGRYMAKSLR